MNKQTPSTISPLIKGYCPHCFEEQSFSVAERKGAKIECKSCPESFTIKESEDIELSPIKSGNCPHCDALLSFNNKARSGYEIVCAKCKKDFLISDVATSENTARKYNSTTSTQQIAQPNGRSFWSTNGRMGRSEYLLWMLLFGFVSFVISVFFEVLEYETAGEIIFGLGLFMLALWIFAASIVLPIKRLHDLNHSGWYVLFAFVPLANIVLGLVCLFQPGTAGVNNYGPKPRSVIQF